MFFITPSSYFSNSLNSVKIRSRSLYPKIARFINKYLYRLGLIGAICNRYDNTITLYSAKKDKKFYKNYSNKAKFLNFGSGAFNHYFWTNYDLPGQADFYKKLQGDEKIDFNALDLCSENLKLPLEEDSCDLIYCSHTLEHLEEHKGKIFLKECHRILKTNGVMRLALPNTDNNFYHAKLIYNQTHIPIEVKNEAIIDCASKVLSEIENLSKDVVIKKVIDTNFSISKFVQEMSDEYKLSKKFIKEQPQRHITYYSHEKMLKISNDLGFKFYAPLYKGSSFAEPFKNLEVFDTTEPQWSIYGELVK